MFLELRHLRTLTALRDFGNLAAAARQLCQTQSALSHQIKAIEHYYAAPLFIRKSRPLRFTPVGERLLELADDILPTVQYAEQALHRISDTRQGRLHIAIECHSCFDWLIPAMNDYRRQWREVEMDLSTGFAFEPIPALARGEVDLVITPDPQDIPSVIYEPLFAYPMMLGVAKNHPLAKRKYIVPDDLREQTLITYPVERRRLDIFNRFLDPAGAQPAGQRTSELTSMIVQLVASGRGVAALPAWALTDYVDNDDVAARSLTENGLWSTLYAAVRGGDRELAFVNAFLQHARQTAFRRLAGISAPVGAGPIPR